MPASLTVNQVVAFNLARARQKRGWTQEEAAKKLAPYLGARWSKQTFSNAERSLGSYGGSGPRVSPREFTANEIAAFARAFEVPISWFFAPPPFPATLYTSAPDWIILDANDDIVYRGPNPRGKGPGGPQLLWQFAMGMSGNEYAQLLSETESAGVIAARLRALADELEDES